MPFDKPLNQMIHPGWKYKKNLLFFHRQQGTCDFSVTNCQLLGVFDSNKVFVHLLLMTAIDDWPLELHAEVSFISCIQNYQYKNRETNVSGCNTHNARLVTTSLTQKQEQSPSY